jgi:hypothetical protein
MSLAPHILDWEIAETIGEIIDYHNPVEYSDKLLKLLNVCPGNLDKDNIRELISWLVNKHFGLLLDIMLSEDITLINRIFDPNGIRNEGGQVSQAAFGKIAAMILDDSDRHEFFIMAVILDFSQEDFDSICSTATSGLTDTDEFRLYRYLESFQRFFQAHQMPRLFQFLSCCSPHMKSRFSFYFKFVWESFDSQFACAGTDYIWNYLFDSQYLNTCEVLEISSELQDMVFREIVARSMAVMDEFQDKEEKPVDKICKFFYFQPYDKNIQDCYERAVLIMFNRLLIVSENFGLLNLTEDTFLHSSERFRKQIVKLIVNFADVLQTETSKKISSCSMEFFFTCDYPEFNWDVFTELCAKDFTKYEEQRWARVLIQHLSMSSHWNLRSRQERRQFLLFLINYDSLFEFSQYVSIMAGDFYLDLRSFEDQVKSFCLRFSSELKVFDIVELVLTRNSKREFHQIYLSLLSKVNYLNEEWIFYPFYTEDPSFLLQVRKILRTKLTLEPIEDYSEHHLVVGVLIARYGDLEDLKKGIESKYCNSFLSGYLSMQCHPRMKIPATIHAKILNIANETLRRNFSMFGCYSRLDDPFLAYVIRYSEDISNEISKVQLQDPHECVAPYLEILIKSNSFDSNKLIEIMKSPKFDDLKYRILGVWQSLDETTKKLICEHRPIFNIYAKTFRDPEFVQVVMKLFRRSSDICYALKEFAKTQDVSVSVVQLTAHWFFVDDFEEEIRTQGHHWMFKIALSGNPC